MLIPKLDTHPIPSKAQGTLRGGGGKKRKHWKKGYEMPSSRQDTTITIMNSQQPWMSALTEPAERPGRPVRWLSG